jgi:hypothetical protein
MIARQFGETIQARRRGYRVKRLPPTLSRIPGTLALPEIFEDLRYSFSRRSFVQWQRLDTIAKVPKDRVFLCMKRTIPYLTE